MAMSDGGSWMTGQARNQDRKNQRQENCAMVTQNPSSSSASPTKPKKAWKPRPAAEGVPSMFAHATLSKPLKVNSATTSTVRRDKSKESKKTVPSNETESQANTTKPKFADKTPRTATPVVTATKAPSTTSIQDSAASAPKVSEKFRYSQTKPKRSSSNDSAKFVIGGCTTVAGTPRSWPKPHAVPVEEKPKIVNKNKSTPKQPEREEEELHKNIDDLIPEMYRKKSAAQLEREQQEEIQVMRRIMWELRQAEMEREEKALQYQPIGNDVEATLRALQNAKKQNDMADDHSSLDDSDATPKKESAYSTHVRSKLAFFNSNHSAKLYESDNESDDSSSVSSWDSDASDGLFRG